MLTTLLVIIFTDLTFFGSSIFDIYYWYLDHGFWLIVCVTEMLAITRGFVEVKSKG